MNNEPLVVERSFNAPIERVWDALTDNKNLQQWYFKLPDFQAKVGFEFEFDGTDNGVVFKHHCRITEVVPQKTLAYTWAYEGTPGTSHVRFDLKKEDDQHTKITITHEGLQELAAKNPLLRLESFQKGWTGILGNSLRKFLED
jgi:uncharacterized protein YndB with AHSA1/START domain